MKNLIALLLVVALVGVTFAQDLDSPKTGAAKDQQQAQQQGGGDIFNQIISQMHATEAGYISGQNGEWEWIQWGYWIGAGTNWNRGGADYGWAADSSIHYELWNQLSPAEFAAAQAEFNASWNRILAAGLN